MEKCEHSVINLLWLVLFFQGAKREPTSPSLGVYCNIADVILRVAQVLFPFLMTF